MADGRARLIGIDVGTSGCKTIVIDDAGRVLARHLVEYPLSTPEPGWAEQDPDLWWQAAREGQPVRPARAAADRTGIRCASVRIWR